MTFCRPALGLVVALACGLSLPLTQPVLAAGQAAAHAPADDHAPTADHASQTHAAGSGCDLDAYARDELRRAANPIVASAMLPPPGCPAFATASEVATTDHTAAAPATPAKSGH